MKILFLSTWFPYPPNQGSKIRAYHLLRAVASRHEVALVSFQDGPLNQAWIDHIQAYCCSVVIIPREPFAQGAIGAALGWFSPKPRAVVGSWSSSMSEAVQTLAREWEPDVILAITFITAPYALEVQARLRVADVDNLLGIMLQEEFQASQSFLQRLRRYIAYRKFTQYERELYRPFDINLVTSELDAGRIREHIPLDPDQVMVVPNGVDLHYFRPGLHTPIPHSMIFNGALSYEPNYDAMGYFLKHIYQRIKREIPDAQLSITGRTDGVDLQSLPKDDQVHFTGYVEDVREVVARSSVCVVPLRKGAGTRLKILEAMALGIPVVTTSKGAEGLAVESGRHLIIADEPVEFAVETVKVLKDRSLQESLSAQGYALVQERYGWEGIGSQFIAQIEDRMNGR